MKLRFETWWKGFLFLLVGSLLWSIWASAQTAADPPSVEFERDLYTVRENERTAVISFKRSGSTNLAVSVLFATADDTAKAETDYLPQKERVSFTPGQTEQTASVRIRDDLQAQGNRSLKLSLSDPGIGTILGRRTSAELSIVDNDGRATAWLTFGLDHLEFLQRRVMGIPLWQYAASLIYVFLAFYVSKMLDYLIRGRLRKWAQKTSTTLDDILLELLRGPIKIISFVLFLHLGLRLFSWPVWFEDFTSKGLQVIVAVSLTYMVLRFIDLMTGYWKRRAASEDDRSFAEQLLPIIRNSLKVFVLIVAGLLMLQNLGLNITSLIASLSIGGLAIGLAAQDTLANFFGAIVVLVDKPFRIGDLVRLDNVEGTVEIIGFRSTRVRTADGHLVAIPNKTVGNATITNIASRPHIRTVINVGISYDTSTAKLRRAIEILVEIFKKNSLTKDVSATFNRFADSALNIQVVHVWKGTDGPKHLHYLHEVNLEIKERFEREGIQFAFPTQTLFVKREGPGQTSSLPAAEGAAASPKH